MMIVKAGKPPTILDYTWTTNDNVIVIDPKDNNFTREGTYYVKISPRVSIVA